MSLNATLSAADCLPHQVRSLLAEAIRARLTRPSKRDVSLEEGSMLQQVLGMLSEEHGLVALEAPTDLQHAADEERVDFVKAEIERRAEALRDALDLYDDEIYSPVPLLVRTKPVDFVEVIERQRKALITNYLPPVALARNNSVPGLGVSHQAEADPVQLARESTGLSTPARFPKINSVPGLSVSHQAEADPVQSARESTGLPTPARFPKPEARVPAPEPLAEVAEDSDFDDPTSPSCSPPSSPPEAGSPPASGLHHRVTKHWNAYLRWEYRWEYGLGGFMFWKDRLPRASATYDSPEEEVNERTLSQRARRKEEVKQQTLLKRARYSFRKRQKASETGHERMPCWKQYFVLFVGSCIVAACTVASITLLALTPPLQQYFVLASYFGSVPLSFLSHFGVRYMVRQLRKHAALWRGRFVEGQFRKVRVQAAVASKRWTSEEDEAAKGPKPKVWKVPDRRLAAVESVDPSATAESPQEQTKRRGVAFAVLPAGAAETEKRQPLRINRMASAYLDNSMLDQTQSLQARKGDGFAQMDRSSETSDGRPRMTRVMSRANLMMGAQIRPFFSTFLEQKEKEENVNSKPLIGPDFDFGPVNRAPSKGTAEVRGRKLVAQKGHAGSQKLSEEALISEARPLRRRGSLGPASPPQVSSSVSSAAGAPTSPSQHL